MITKKVNTLYEKNTYYPWIIVAISILTVFFSGPGQTYFISGFIDSFIEEFELTRTMISVYYSSMTFIAGILLMFVGRLIDRFGHRRMTVIIAGLLGLTCFLCGVIPTAMLLFVTFFLLRLLGQGSMVLLPSTLIPNWFTKKRAVALSLVTLGGAIGSVIIPIINTYALTIMSWRKIWMMWGTLLIAFFIPLVLLFLRNKPYVSQDEAAMTTMEYEESWTLLEAIKTRTFWSIVFSQSVPAFVCTGLYFHMYSIMEQGGLPVTVAAMTLSAIGFFSFPSTFLAGYVLERVPVHKVYALTFAVQTLGMVLLIFTSNTLLAICFAIIFGSVTGFQNVCRRLIWPEYYGREHLGSISGLTMTALVIGSSLGPIIIGAGFDLIGSYTKVILLVAVAPLLATLLCLFSPKPTK